jgi:hypothetical protein
VIDGRGPGHVGRLSSAPEVTVASQGGR